MASGSPQPIHGEISNFTDRIIHNQINCLRPTISSIGMMPASTRADPQSQSGREHLLSLGLPPSPSVREIIQEGSMDLNSADEDQKHRPPMSVIVVSSPATQDGTPTSSSSRRELRPPSTCSPSLFAAPFRLQPRTTMTMATPGRDGSIRGRKRSAQSMHSTSKLGSEALLTSKQVNKPSPFLDATAEPSLPLVPPAVPATTPKRPIPCGLTPPRDTRRGVGRVDNTMVNFQCLSLQSPIRKVPSPPSPKCFSSPPPFLPNGFGRPPSASSSSSGTTSAQRPTMVLGSVGSFQSPAVSSSGIKPRSSFTLYNSASPCGSLRSIGSGSIGSNARINLSARAIECCGSAKSSPKIAPLTVLQDRGTKVVPSKDSTARRPPLPGGGTSSLWHSLDSSNSGSGGVEDDGREDDTRMLPPRTVHCRRPSTDSISTVHNGVLSPLPRPSPKRSPNAFSSPASASGIPKPSTPRSKQRKLDQFSSPNQRTPRTPQNETPLPRVTLTPRSTGSRRSRQSGLPRFPSPSDVDIMDVTSPFLNSAAVASLRGASGMNESTEFLRPRDSSTIKSMFPMSSNSLALSADGSANEAKEGPASRGQHPKAQLPVLNLLSKSSDLEDSKPSSLPNTSDLSGGTFMGIHTVSLLHSSRPGGFLRSMMEERANRMNSEGSVSDIDDDEGFILASPRAIEEERFASCQPARQRRRRSCDRFSNAPRGSPSLDLSPNDASNTNLAGMNYVTSNTSLFGMDIAHPTDHQTGAAAPGDKNSKAPSDSMFLKKATVFGNSTTNDQGSSLQDPHCFKRRKSDASFDSIGLALDFTGGRDLVTPPTVPNPETPPPLSPKAGLGLGLLLPSSTTGPSFERTKTVCVAGADRQSVTIAIARMASEAQGHADSPPVL